ncbi:MAG: hypothetical protein F8N36_14260 [Desulfovibrio sp.]|uniref:hypothetical protein n=1 Tax=Desulfovibrio sp. TaxID=885 RepID=UPI00135D9C93|nr:hypothetical protein [Desulfovibrio sp.]MTJ94002.1 hypothetical protein [Desulfovibrio sp.]
MDYKEAFGFEVAPGKKKARLITILPDLISLREQGASYEQLKQYVEKTTGMHISTDWVEKTVRAMKKK